jgi:mannose-6-phosphate isomerase-like protein (cupin superfamily)
VAAAKAQIQLPGAGRSIGTAGVSILLKSAADETDGRWTLYEYAAPPRFAGPPPHWHKQTDEAFFVLEGTIRFEVDGEVVDAPAGGYVRVAPGVVHRFSNPTDEPARFLGLIVPAGFEQYWVELAGLMAAAPSWPPEDMTPVLELMAKYDTFPPPSR